MEKEILEVREFISIYTLSDAYGGVRIIGENEIRTAKEHNAEVDKRRSEKPREVVAA